MERCMRNMARNYPMIVLLLYHVFDPIWKKWTIVGDMWIKRWVDGLRPCKSEGEEGWHGIVLLVGTFGSAWKFSVIHGNVRQEQFGDMWFQKEPRHAEGRKRLFYERSQS